MKSLQQDNAKDDDSDNKFNGIGSSQVNINENFRKEQENLFKIMEACFDLLKNFCGNDNQANKKLLYSNIKFFTLFLQDGLQEVGQTELINIIYKDN